VLDILSKAGLLGCRASDTLIETNVKLLPDQRKDLDNPGGYRRLLES